MKRFSIAALCAAAVLTVAACSGGLDKSIWAPRSVPPQAQGAIGLPDGVFSGVGVGGMHGDIHVDVTVAGNAITDITVTQHHDTATLAASVFRHAIGEIKRTQSTGFNAADMSAGATITTGAFLRAVEDALTQAGADLEALREGPPPVLSLTAGTFNGVGNGRNGPVSLNVTFSSNAILDIAVESHSETPGFGDRAIAGVIPAILEKQSVSRADATAGATLTSNAIKEAVTMAMEASASGEAPDAQTVPAPATPAPEAETPAPVAETTATPAATAAAPRFTAGTYQASAKGFVGDIHVEVVFNETGIVSVTVGENSETPEIVGDTMTSLPRAMVVAQTYDVDIVAGATFASNAIREAVRLTMEQASN